MKVGIGQILKLKEDIVVSTFLKDKKEILKKGTQIQILADKEFMAFEDGCMMKIPSEFEVDGFSAKGIAGYIYNKLDYLPLSDMLNDYEISEKEFKDIIVYALEELSFYNHEGNIS